MSRLTGKAKSKSQVKKRVAKKSAARSNKAQRHPRAESKQAAIIAMLQMPNKEVWTFNAYEEKVDIEESVYLAGPDGPRRTPGTAADDVAAAR